MRVESPGPYTAVVSDFKALLDQYIAADLEGTKPIKAVLFRVGARRTEVVKIPKMLLIASCNPML